MPSVLNKDIVGRLLELTAFDDKEDSSDIMIVLSDIAPDNVMEQLEAYSRNLTISDIQKHANQLGQWLVSKGWGIAVAPEAHRFKVEMLKMTDEDPCTVSRYAPMNIDGKVYFAVGIPGPAGEFRRDASGFAMMYVDPITGGEYYRKLGEVMGRSTYASVEKVQEVLEHLHPDTYQAVAVTFKGDMESSVTLILRKPVCAPILSRVNPAFKGETTLSSEDKRLIEKFHKRIDPSDRMGTVILAAHLLEAQTSSRFVRLALSLIHI